MTCIWQEMRNRHFFSRRKKAICHKNGKPKLHFKAALFSDCSRGREQKAPQLVFQTRGERSLEITAVVYGNIL